MPWPKRKRERAENRGSSLRSMVRHGRTVISREDFAFVIGYSGSTAIVDAWQRRRYGGLGTLELAQRGLYRAALASAIHGGREEEMRAVLGAYNSGAAVPVESVEHLKRLFGVSGVPPGITHVKRL